MRKELFQDKYRIKSNRWDDWDYSWDGFYFVTICTKNKKKLFGKIIDGKVNLTEIGVVASQCWKDIPMHFPHVKLDEFIVMPDHIHGIVQIKNPVETQNFASLQKHSTNVFGPQSRNLGSIIRGFKIGVKKYAAIHNIPFFWQSRYYDRVLRDDYELYFAQEYIADNPINP